MRILITFISCMLLGLPRAFAIDSSDWHEPFPPHRGQSLLRWFARTRFLSGNHARRTHPDQLQFRTHRPNDSRQHREARVQNHRRENHPLESPHGDHVEGQGLMQELTGAKVFAMEGDAEVMRNGGKGQYLYDDSWRPCRVDRVLKDGDKVTLGGTTLIAHLTSGHTRGCTTWTMTATDGKTSRNVVIVGSPNVNPGFQLVNNRDYPQIATDYQRTFKVLKSLPCDIFLGAHGNYYDMEKKFAQLKPGASSNPFVDPQGYRAYIDDREKAFLAVLEKQSGK